MMIIQAKLASRICIVISVNVYLSHGLQSLGIGPIPWDANYDPRLLDVPRDNRFDDNAGPSCNAGPTILCRGRLPESDQYGRLKNLFVERCDPSKMKSLSLDDLHVGSSDVAPNLKFIRYDCEYGDSSTNRLELEAPKFEVASTNSSPLISLAIISANVRHIPEGFLNRTSRLGRLDFTRNRLANVTELAPAFGSPDQLLELVLSRNRFQTIADDSFVVFRRLDTLDLSHNLISNLEPNCLNGMKNLRYLNLKGNRLASLPNSLFVNVAGSLVSLDLADNLLVDGGVYPALDIRHSTPLNLQVLHLGRNRLTSVNGQSNLSLFEFGDGRRPSLMLALRYDSNRIRHLPAGVFSQLANLSLIDLSNNSIETIKSDAFVGLSNLIHLDLSNNSLTSFDDDDSLVRCCLDSLMVVNVAHNRLRSLPNVTGLRQLYTLNASFNYIESLDNVHFAGASIINTVDLSHNLIESVRNTTFGFQSSMIELRLDHNSIRRLDNGSFGADQQRSVMLRTLRLDSNRLRSVAGVFRPTGVFGDRLQRIDLSHNRLESFSYVDVPYGVRDLRLADNRLSTLGEPFRYDMPPQTHLDYLDVSANGITKLAVNSFPSSVGLLMLAGNRIDTVEDFALLDKRRITIIDLRNNSMTNACPAWFALDPTRFPSNPTQGQSIARPRLLIAGNPLRCTCQLNWIASINLDTFSRTFPLVADFNRATCSPTFLHNNRRQIEVATNAGSPEFIPLSGNGDNQFLCNLSDGRNETSSCPCAKFGVWPGPSRCQVSRCPPPPCRCYIDGGVAIGRQTLIVDCSMADLEAPPIAYPTDVTVFYLDGNNVSRLTRESFRGIDDDDDDHLLDALTELYLNFSRIVSIGDGTFERMRAGLQSLFLQDNLLESISANTFLGLGKLRVLLLSNNRLKQINDGTFSPTLVSLQFLELESNRLEQFPVWKVERNLDALDYVSLAYNPWSCDCEFIEPFRIWLQSFSGVVANKDNITCTHPGEDWQFQLSALNDSLCRNDTLVWLNGLETHRIPLALSVTLAIAFAVVTLASLLVYFRHEIQVLVYSRYGVRLIWLTHRVSSRATESPDEMAREEADKPFDAFVSYSSLDEDLVVELVDRLERSFDPPYRLCLHHRNFVGGALITESIVEAVEKSCRTILLLSENFLASEWCRFEFRAAYLQMLKDRRNRVIVVLVGPLIVDRSRIDREINYYLKTNTYLRFDDRLFWKKLCYALPDRLLQQQQRE